MTLARFEEHLRDPAPGFRCYDCEDDAESINLLARVRNVIGEPGDAQAIAMAKKSGGAASPALVRFVELHDGVLLYRDSQSEEAGVEFFPAKKWQSRTTEMRESMAEMGLDEDDMPEWFLSGVVFGEIPHSGNYFVIQPSGPEAGQIFYCDHDDFRIEPIAESFEAFLAMIVNDPPGFLYQRGCYARYSDGESDTQWIPKEYVPDCRD